ncbi:MAG TPA: extracellular solute-binding protein, partial [Gemmatimonadales bacterium]|nr:extracellular solute-binding protein [Gemmatimonadales bacterium]
MKRRAVSGPGLQPGIDGPGLLVLALLTLASCHPQAPTNDIVIDFWGLGREGEVAQEMMPEFEAEHPGVHVHVQQIPWTAAHEKLLTAYVGHVSPDVAQLGNTWVPEYVALGALVPLDSA